MGCEALPAGSFVIETDSREASPAAPAPKVATPPRHGSPSRGRLGWGRLRHHALRLQEVEELAREATALITRGNDWREAAKATALIAKRRPDLQP